MIIRRDCITEDSTDRVYRIPGALYYLRRANVFRPKAITKLTPALMYKII